MPKTRTLTTLRRDRQLTEAARRQRDDAAVRTRQTTAGALDTLPDAALPRRRRPTPLDRETAALKARGEDVRPAYTASLPGGTLYPDGYGRAFADEMAVRLDTLLIEGGPWTTAERVNLTAARRVWRRRAEGLDARYALFGSGCTGRLSPGDAARLQAYTDTLTVLDDLGALAREAQALAYGPWSFAHPPSDPDRSIPETAHEPE